MTEQRVCCMSELNILYTILDLTPILAKKPETVAIFSAFASSRDATVLVFQTKLLLTITLKARRIL